MGVDVDAATVVVGLMPNHLATGEIDESVGQRHQDWKARFELLGVGFEGEGAVTEQDAP